MAKTKVLICPYCGETQPAGERCRGCGGLFDALSRQATHNAMGPWFIRDDKRPFHPGCSYETLVKLIDRGIVDRYTLLRGPTTRQYWTVAKHVPGISHLLGYCHNCDASVDPGDHGCHACGVPFGAYLDRNYMGLPDIKPLPWESDEDGEAEGAVRGVVTWGDDAPTPEPGQMGGPGFGAGHVSAAGAAAQRGGAHGVRGGARISSFATNEELLQRAGKRPGDAARGDGGNGPDTLSAAEAKSAAGAAGATSTAPASATVRSASRAATSAAAPSPASATEVAAAPAKTTEPFATHPVARSMRRRIERQRRTIRLLASMAIVLGVFCVLLATPHLMDMAGNDGSGAGTGTTNGTMPGTSGGAGTDRSDDESGGNESGAAGANDDDAGEPGDDAEATGGAPGDEQPDAPPTVGDDIQAPPIGDPADDADSTGAGDGDAGGSDAGGGSTGDVADSGEADSGGIDQLTRARDLLRAARDQSRDARTRLADAKKALESLRVVVADSRSGPDLAAQLSTEVTKTEELIKQLETIVFFDDDQ